ncbi:MAG: hypothetical protein H6822_15845 [Planctomycetaceae bacterium]|nr:hypothetical protein [Planctomycetales bacterium]MCB9923653.1 hypothetical protein [Planctomycetaceae bacterium]
MRYVFLTFIASISLHCAHSAAADPNIERRLPPPGINIPADQLSTLTTELQLLKADFASVKSHERDADAAVFIKAVDYALLHNEFYNAKDVQKAQRLLAAGKERVAELKEGRSPWARQAGLVVRGYRSRIDDSVQPYGLEIPANLDFRQRVPLVIWLHGRGDTATDMHFIDQRLTKHGQIPVGDAIVLHPFGRQCVGYKSAGEIDVWEAASDVLKNYQIDMNRIVLMGFSMGGAGAWHLGAHYADSLVAISPGAGFAETARYNNLAPDAYPPWYEQLLWGQYDVPDYVRNLLNVPVFAYSGELDKQIQAARVMEEAYRANGSELPHVIGPGMGHKYHPDSLKELLRKISTEIDTGLRTPKRVTFQTKTLRYNEMFWVQTRGLREHWRDARIDAEVLDKGLIQVTTKNITELRLTIPQDASIQSIEIDGKTISLRDVDSADAVVDLKYGDEWQLFDPRQKSDELKKRIGLHGPIDDAFMEPFMVVTPSGKSANSELQRWIDFEQQHFVDRWRALMRGELRIKRDIDVTEDDLLTYHLVAWGTPETNLFLRDFAKPDVGNPMHWTDETIHVGTQQFDAANHVPVFIYPRGERYLVVNSGLTFREGHDRTNSLQNPKLPDWAVLDIRQPPNEFTAGKVVAADFFDESWQVKDRVISPESRSETP